jgi:hypothetical protein
MDGDMVGHRPTSAFCHRNMEVIRHIFSLLGAEDDRELSRIFFAWIRSKSVREIWSEGLI